MYTIYTLIVCSVLKKEWILAKYQREEFTDPDRQTAYNCSHKEGMLWKLGRDRKQFQLRKFVLSRAENKFSYFINEDSKQVYITFLKCICLSLYHLCEIDVKPD